MQITRSKTRLIARLLLALVVLGAVLLIFPAERVLYYGQVLLARDVNSQLGKVYCAAFPYGEPQRTLRVLTRQPTATCFDSQWEAENWFRENIDRP